MSVDIYSFINENNRMYEIRHYLTEDNKDVYLEWLKVQRDTVAKIAIVKRINRMELGNFGDHEFCRDGVWELRIDVGAGYRVYYAISGKEINCCYVVAINARRRPILTVPVNTGATGGRRTENERQTTR